MKLKDISRTATFAWDQSSSSNPLLATGAIAGALDENFSNESQLEIWAPDFGESQGMRLGGDGQGPAGSITVNSRFNRLAWSTPTADKKKGVIAAGMETGEVSVFDPSKILAGASAEEARVFSNNKHTGPVRGLDFNPIQKNLLLTGAVNAELCIYDLNNPLSAPIPPGPLSTKLNEITSLQWNPTVSRVFAASSSSGYTSVWDLKAQKEIVSLQYGGGAAKGSDVVAGAAGLQMGKRRGMSDVCWHPESATRLITASEDDESPIIMLWDLRNTRAPEKILSGHHKGVLSVSWCKQDADLLLSCGKDNRTLCWNPHSGEIIGELPATSDWSFQTTWCPRNPDLLATAAFDGHIGIHSLQTTQLPEQPLKLGDKASADDIFGALGDQEQPEASVLSLKQPPKWLRRPVSATFGYGGLLASTTTVSGKSVVQLRKVVSEEAIIDRAEKLSEAKGDKERLAELCSGRVSETGGDEAWKALQTLFKANSRDEIVQLLGFNKADVEKRVLEAIKKLPGGDKLASPVKDKEEEEDRAPTPTPARSEAGSVAPSEVDKESDAGSKLFDDAPNSASADFFSSMAAGTFKNPVLDHIMNQKAEVAESSRAATMGSQASSVRSENIKDNTFRIYPSGESDTDKLITQALVLGDFSSAVDLCLASERFADALLLAVRGGAELLQSTQKAYFARKTTSTPFLRVYQSIVTEDLADIVQNADLNEWRVIFAVVCTFAKDAEFNNLADQLGQRLQYKAHTAEDKTVSRTARQDATLCYLAARKLEKVVSIWSEEMKEEEESVDTTRYTAHALALQSFIEKVAVFSAATGYIDQDLMTPTESREAAEAGARTYKLASLYDRYYEYADLLAMQGLVDLAAQYVKLTPADYKGSSVGDLEKARDRLLRAAGVQDIAPQASSAFGSSAVASSSKAPAAARGYGAPSAPSSAYQPVTPLYAQAPPNVPTVPAAQPQAYQTNRSFVPAPPQPATFGGDSPYAPSQSYQAPQSSAPYAPSQQQSTAYAPSGYNSAPNGYGQPSYNYNAPPSTNLPPPPRANQVGNGTDTPPLVPASQRRDLPGWNDAPSLSGPPKRPQSAAKEIRAAPIMSPFPMAEGAPAPGPFAAPPSGPPSSFTPPPPRAAPGVLPPPPKGGPRPPSAQKVAQQAQAQPSMAQAPPQFAMQQPTPPPGPQRGPPSGSPAPPPQAAQAPPPPRGPPRAGPPPNALGSGLTGPPPPRALSPLGPPGRQITPLQGMQGMAVGPRPPSAQSQRAGPPPPGAPKAGPPPPGRVNSVGPPPSQIQQQQQQQRSPQQQQQASMPMSPPVSAQSPVQAAPMPAPAKPRHPAGDRSHITDEGRPIFETFDRAMTKVKQSNLPAHLKKIIDDTERRLGILFDSLNNDAVPKDALGKTAEIARAIDAGDLNTALALHVQLMTVASGDVASWAPGVKQLIRLSV